MAFFLLQRSALVGVLVGVLFSAMPLWAGAQGTVGRPGSPGGAVGGTAVIENPLKVTNICDALREGYKFVVMVGIPVAVLFIIWAGFKFVLAQGNPGALKKAQKNFLYTVAGIALFLAAWLLVVILGATVNAVAGGNLVPCTR
jgi:hypothetical protein